MTTLTKWTCPRCEDGDEPCACGAWDICPATWDRMAALGESKQHRPARLGGCEHKPNPPSVR